MQSKQGLFAVTLSPAKSHGAQKMTVKGYKILSLLLSAVVVMLGFTLAGQTRDADCDEASRSEFQRYELTRGIQTSARYLNKIAKLDACLDPGDVRKQKIHTLIKDLEIKSSSYSLMNKVFFWLSLALAFAVVSFPVISKIAGGTGTMSKIFDPVQLPVITLLAGLCFSFYTDYKGKQTSAENLIRYAYTSSDNIEVISRTVRNGLAEIDSGHDFSELLKSDE